MCITSSSLKRNGHLPLSVFLLTPFNCYTLLVATVFHFFLSLNIILYMISYPKRSLFLGIELELFSDSFAKNILCFNIASFLHYLRYFLSSYTLFASFVQMLIKCDTEPKCPQTGTKVRYSTVRRLLQYYQWDKHFLDVSRVISRHF
jgi:hypothetical protein